MRVSLHTEIMLMIVCHIAVAGRGVSLFHLHGETAGRASVSALLQAVLLPLHSEMADRD